MADPVPVILCGQVPHIVTAFRASIQPEYEGANPPPLQYLNTSSDCPAIHVILSLDAGVSEIPALLRGEKPPSEHHENLGTRNYSKPPAAVVTGGGYDEAMVKDMRDACNGESNVPWLRPDMGALPPHGPGYGAAMAEKVKACLRYLAEEGKMKEDGVYFY